MGKKIAIRVENKTFNSLQDACAYLKIQHVAGLAHAVKHGNKQYKGLNIEVIPTESKVKGKRDKRPCPVVCENLNLHFKTITAAAKYAQVDGWTMSKKMETAGQFVDSKGNVFKRLKAMKTKNVYENTGDTIKTSRPFAHRTVKKKAYVQPEVKEVKPVVQPAQPINKLELARDVLKEKVIESVKANDLTLAKNLIDVIQEL